MKRLVFSLAVLTLVLSRSSGASPITGDLVVAGLDSFTSNTVNFTNPGTIIEATGSLAVMKGATNLMLDNITSFATEPGKTFFSWTGAGGSVTVTMDITTWTVTRDNANFLNALGTATLTETGFATTPYDFSFTSTKPDGVSSYTFDLTPPSPVAEPASLFLVGTGLLLFGWMYYFRKKYEKHAL